jgi:6-phosphogluconolactonase
MNTKHEQLSLVVVDTPEDVAQTLAESFGVAARNAIAERGTFSVALAGGSTPKAAYALLASPPYRDTVDWPRVHFFFGDERCVPPDHPDSNVRMARETLLGPLHIDEAHIFRMRGEDDPAAAAQAYAALLAERLGALPEFDLVLLGMGPDGHTASLFPGAPPDDGSDALVQVRTAPPSMKVSNRLTLTPRVINAARKVVISVTGKEKADILARVLNGPHDPTAYPVQIVRPVHGRLTWLVDRAAAPT